MYRQFEREKFVFEVDECFQIANRTVLYCEAKIKLDKEKECRQAVKKLRRKRAGWFRVVLGKEWRQVTLQLCEEKTGDKEQSHPTFSQTAFFSLICFLTLTPSQEHTLLQFFVII